jgi:hypothetical protein
MYQMTFLQGPKQVPADVPWHSLATELGIVAVQPMNLDVLKIQSDCLTINRVRYQLYGPLYRDGQRWTAYKPGKTYGADPDFTLLRFDDVTRQGSHAAYQQAVGVIETAANAWTPAEHELAALAVRRIESDIAKQQTKLAGLRSDLAWRTKYQILLKVQEDYLVELFTDLERAQESAGIVDKPPQIIPLGATRRPDARPLCPPPQVQRPEDLPRRFFIGDLDSDSFSADRAGWRVRYGSGVPSTFAELGYRAETHQLVVDMSWRGNHFGPSFLPGRDWELLPQVLSMAFQAWNWDDVEGSRLEARFNVRYVRTSSSTDTPTDDGLPVLCGMPDGILKVIAVPIAVARLRQAAQCMNAIDGDPNVATSVSAYAILGTSVVNYAEGLCSGLPADPVALARHALAQLGTPASLPVREGPAFNGSYALTLRRAHYTLLVSCTFRDLERVTDHLFEHGLVGPAAAGNSPQERYPEAAEYAALVMPAGAEIVLEEQTWWDASQTRRMFYGRILQPDLLTVAVESASAGPDEVLEQVAAVEAWHARILPRLQALHDR